MGVIARSASTERVPMAAIRRLAAAALASPIGGYGDVAEAAAAVAGVTGLGKGRGWGRGRSLAGVTPRDGGDGACAM